MSPFNCSVRHMPYSFTARCIKMHIEDDDQSKKIETKAKRRQWIHGVVGEHQTAPTIHYLAISYFNGHISFSPPLSTLFFFLSQSSLSRRPPLSLFAGTLRQAVHLRQLYPWCTWRAISDTSATRQPAALSWGHIHQSIHLRTTSPPCPYFPFSFSLLLILILNSFFFPALSVRFLLALFTGVDEVVLRPW